MVNISNRFIDFKNQERITQGGEVVITDVRKSICDDVTERESPLEHPERVRG
jgi:hypothetical protein